MPKTTATKPPEAPLATRVEHPPEAAEKQDRNGEPSLMAMVDSLLARVDDPNQAMGVVERMLAAHEREQARKAREAYSAAMTACQKAMPTVVADSENSHTKSTYASLENVMATCRSVWVENGITISFSQAESPTEGMVRVEMRVGHAGHTETFWREAKVDDTGPSGTKNKTDVQGRQSTASYLQRQMLCSVFNIAIAGSDQDGNATFQPVSPEQEAHLQDIIAEMGGISDRQREWLLQSLGAGNLSLIPASKFDQAKSLLQQIADRKRERASA